MRQEKTERWNKCWKKRWNKRSLHCAAFLGVVAGLFFLAASVRAAAAESMWTMCGSETEGYNTCYTRPWSQTCPITTVKLTYFRGNATEKEGARVHITAEDLDLLGYDAETIESAGNKWICSLKIHGYVCEQRTVTSLADFVFDSTIPAGEFFDVMVDLEGQKSCTYTGEPITVPTYAYALLEDGSAKLLQYFMLDGKETSLTVPSAIDGNPVTAIKDGFFGGNKTLKSITLPDTITTIDQFAFTRCEALETVQLPRYLTSLSDGLFMGCGALQDITIPDTVTEIGLGTFQNCVSLETIKLPEGITTLSERTFMSCAKLTDIELPATLTSIETIVFMGCDSLEKLTIPDTVSSIGSCAFCTCNGLKTIEIPGSVTTIGYAAFAGCPNLTSVTLADGVETLAESVFDACSALEQIRIPASVTSIGANTFKGCDSLTTILYGGTPEQWSAIYGDEDHPVASLLHRHHAVLSEGRAPTCTLAGAKEYYSCDCGGYYEDADCTKEIREDILSWRVIAPTGKHDLTAHAEAAPSCIKAGRKAYWSCGVCGKTYADAECKVEFTEDPESWSMIAPTGKHDLTAHAEAAPSCTEAGRKAYWSCGVCGKTYADAECKVEFTEDPESWRVIAPTGHTAGTVARIPATFEADGYSAGTKCSVCDTLLDGCQKIPRIDQVALSAKTYVYNGKKRSPKLVIMSADGKEIPADCYTVSVPAGRKNVGKYTYQITFREDYAGSKALSFSIRPEATRVTGVKAASRSLTVSVKKQTKQTTGYEIQVATNKNFTKNVKKVFLTKNKKTTKTISGLKGGKKYYVRVRTYKTIKRTRYYSGWKQYAKPVRTQK